jgi:hypothetical protein
MPTSEARIRANQQNALLSTGPKTPEGKAVSRANALKHGLCAAVCVPEDPEQIQARAEMFFKTFKPTTDYQAWHVDRAAVVSVRIERCERMERRVRDKDSLHAELTWDDDRRLEAEVLGGRLPGRPAETVEALRRTPHGCAWLIARWALLAHAADTQPDHLWTAEQTSMAFDLLGTPAAFRVGPKPGTSIDFRGHVLENADDSAAVARRMIDELIQRREALSGLDEVDRALAVADLDADGSSELRRLRRYESALHRRLRWSIGQMQLPADNGKADPFFYPTYQVDPAPPEEKPEPKHPDEKLAEAHDPNSPHPPFCLTPDEFPPIDQKADIPKILKSRREKRRKKAETKREADREKVRKLKA